MMEKADKKDTKIVVAMSGGVDSSVAAALLVDQGFEVSGVMLKTWESEFKPGVFDLAQEKARKVANQLNIPFQVIDIRPEFHKQVVDYFKDAHAKGLTPNPCYVCNRHIKWGLLLKIAINSGAEKLASGHYAQVRRGEGGKIVLSKAADKTKDQSYVLAALDQSQLNYAMFPLGGMSKNEVRIIAHSYGFQIKREEESQDLCFLEGQSQEVFLRRYAPGLFVPGVIKSVEGKVIGKHEGLALFTIGQRKGIQVSHSEPYYIVRKDMETNSLIVGTKARLGIKWIKVSDVNWISGEEPPLPASYQVKVRNKAAVVEAMIMRDTSSGYNIIFEDILRDPTPGQYAVFYDGDRVVGSGVITETLTGEHQ